MPIYEYKCEDGHITAHLSSLDQRDKPRQCGEQGCSLHGQKIMSATPTDFRFADRTSQKLSR